MTSIRLTEPGRFEIIETGPPNPPGPKEALIRVEHVGLCGTDIHAFHGRQPFFSYPRILGHELGVVVEKTGSEVTAVSPGDRCAVEPYLARPGDRAFARGKTNCSASTQCLGVHVDGGMRPRILMPAEKLHASGILDTRALALTEMLCIGCHAVERARLLGDELVAVVGLGPIGLAAAQFAILKGAKVVLIDVAEERLQMARRIFPEAILLKSEVGVPIGDKWKVELGEFPEVVFECTGNAKSMEKSIELPDYGGRIILVGLCLEDIAFNDPSFHKRELSIISSRNATARNFKEVISQLESGSIHPDRWITHECKAVEFPNVVNDWLQPDSGLLKGMIKFGHPD